MPVPAPVPPSPPSSTSTTPHDHPLTVAGRGGARSRPGTVGAMPAAALNRDRLTWLAYGQFAAFGYFFYGFGPVVPLLRVEQHTSRGVAGLHGTAFALGGMLGGALAPWLVRR